MAIAKTVSLRKFNEQINLVEQLTEDLKRDKTKLSRSRVKCKSLTTEMQNLKKRFLEEIDVKEARIFELECVEFGLKEKFDARDKNSEATVADLRKVIDQQKRELERLRTPAHGKSLTKSSSQGVVEAAHAKYTHVIPGGKAGA